MSFSKITEFGRELSLPNRKKRENFLCLLNNAKDRLEKNIREGTKKTEYESYTHCLKAVCSAIAFLDRIADRGNSTEISRK